MSTPAPIVYSPRPALFITLAMIGVSLVCLAVALYSLAAPTPPGALAYWLPAPVLACLVATALAWMFYVKQDQPNDRWMGVAAAGILAGMACMWAIIGLVMPQARLANAQENIGRPPAMFVEASRQVQAQPWNLPAAVAILRPALSASASPEEFKVFKAAAGAGVKSPEIDWVMANGLVTAQAKQGLLETLVAELEANPDPRLASLLAQVQGGSTR